MKRAHLSFVLKLLIVLLLQILVLNELFLWRYATPFAYPLLLFFFPIDTKKAVYTLTGGLVGLLIDAVSATAGLHTAAFTAVSFLYGYLLPFFVVADADPSSLPSVQRDASKPFVLLLLILLLHHLILFSLDAIGSASIGYLALRMLCSLISSYVIAMIVMLFTNRKSK